MPARSCPSMYSECPLQVTSSSSHGIVVSVSMCHMFPLSMAPWFIVSVKLTYGPQHSILKKHDVFVEVSMSQMPIPRPVQ